ncbi:MAG: hypothetical protein ACKVU2_18815 [Saprospiraceae bacterium]
MQKQKIFLIATLLSLLAVAACNKDSILDRFGSGNDSSTSARSEEATELDIPLTDYTLSASTPLSVKEGRKALAYAVSAEMLANPNFRTALYGLLSPNQVRYKEILLGTFKNQVIACETSGATVNKTVQELLNDRLIQLEAFATTLNPLGVLLAQDKMVCLWFPNEYINSDVPNMFQDAMPVITSENNANLMFLGKKKGEITESDAYMGLHVSEAQVNLLYNPTTQTYYNGSIPFAEMHGFQANSCTQVASILANLPEYELQPGYKVVNILEDIQAPYANNCVNPDVPTQVSDRNGPDYACPRGEYELKLKGNYDKHANFFTGFRLNNLAAFDQINAHPCNGWNAQGVRAFMFKWLVAIDGQVEDVAREHLVHCYQSDLIKITVTFIPVYYYHQNYSIGMPVGPPIKKLLYKKKEVTRELRTFAFPEPSPLPVFSRSEENNHWKPNSNGDVVWFDAHLVHFGPCTATNSTVTTQQYQIGGGFKFKIPLIDTEGNLSWQTTNTVQKTVTYQITAGANYFLGNTKLEYCQPYDNPTKWSQSNSTGTVTLLFDCPWYN